jgi:O-antigen ligase
MMSRLDHTEKFLWALLLLLVPVSASPLLPFGSGTLVRPLSFLPALLLLMLAAFRIAVLRQKPRWPGGGGWLLGAFVGYVVIAGLILLSNQPETIFKGQAPLDSFVRALATLAVGLVFYGVSRLNIRTAQDVRATIRFLFIGVAASIALAVLQVIAIVQRGTLLHEVQALTDLFAVHYVGLMNRAQGMSFEPSWLATQIVLLMIPPLVARFLSNQAAPDAPANRRNVMIALAGFGVALTGLLCAGSRFGLIAAMLIFLLASAMALKEGRMAAALAFIAVLAVGGGGIAAFGALSAGAGAGYVVGPVAYLMEGSVDTQDQDLTTAVTDTLAVAGRAAAAQAGFNLWLDHALFGVSLGNNYRYFGRYAPDWAYDTGLFAAGTMEGAAWLDPDSPEKGNAKNFFLRLLSETGLVGLVLFGAFFVRQIFQFRASDKFYAFFRLTSAAALVFSFFNQDSFADPCLWILLVLCQTMGRLQSAEPA